MLRGYFYVGTSIVDSNAMGGFANSKNIPKPITNKILRTSTKDTLQIIVDTDAIVEMNEEYEGYKVYIVNTTNQVIKLPAQDSRIYVKRQVFYKNEWHDIEYLPSSWCGNSYHNVFINPDHFWDLKAPCLKGDTDAMFRFELMISKEKHIYSNTFFGSFNLKQLSNKQGHSPNDIMDPYIE